MTARQLLTLDLLGALGTAATTGGLFATGWLDVGIPHWILAIMALLALAFACFDAGGLMLAPDARTPLAVIAVLNVAYCCLSLVVCLIYTSQLTPLGIAYFTLEALILIPLAWFEWHVCSRP